ncbi:hypothetical protein JOE59_000744 [Agromyces cerinus]|nr:hypothetical protein [Agromyces cerinus]
MGRAVRSALASAVDGRVRVIVVCHGIGRIEIAEAIGDAALDPRVELLEFVDGVSSPAGPVNAGLDAATAEFVFRLDSDDELEAGAIDSMLAMQQRDAADVVIPVIMNGRRGPLLSPRVRRGRRSRLAPVADRLAYRTHAFALIRRERFGRLRLQEGLATGEDLEFTTSLWFSSARISFDLGGPGYLMHDDAADRITAARRRVGDDLACVERLLASESFAACSGRPRRAIAVKLIRNHLLATLRNRPRSGDWDEADREAAASTANAILETAPHAARSLSVAERRMLQGLCDPTTDLAGLLAYANRPRRMHELLLTGDLLGLLDADAPLRMTSAARSLTREVNASRARRGVAS